MTHPLSSADISIFLPEIFKDYFLPESLKVVLINMVAILILSVKVAALGLLKVKVFGNKGYDVIIFV